MADSALYTVALLPRLAHVRRLLEEIVGELQSAGDPPRQDAALCLNIMLQCGIRMGQVRRMEDIPHTMLPVIPALRTASARLAESMPRCSHIACEMAVHLGSIVLDAAILSGTAIDISPCRRSTEEMLATTSPQIGADSASAPEGTIP